MTQFTELDFDRYSPTFFLIDKKAGLRISLGTLGTVEKIGEQLVSDHGHAMLSLTINGMEQDQLDRHCQNLGLDCARENISILVTKSRHPFDCRWYIFGDLKNMLEAATLERVRLPFHKSLIENLTEGLNRLGSTT